MSDYKLVPVEPTAEIVDLIKRLRIKAGKIELGELIAWGSDSALMREAADVLERAGSAPAVQGEPVAITDADILAIAGRVESCPVSPWWLKDDVAIGDVRAAVLRFARALLVATLQPAEREIPGSYPVSGQIFFREPSNEWVLELTGSVNGTRFTARHTQPADTRPEDVAGLPSLYEPASDVAGLVGKVRMLIATGNRLSAEAQECTYDDCAAEVASVDFWGEFRDALEAATEALAAHSEQGGEV